MGGNYLAYELKPGDTVKEGFVKVIFDKGAHGEKLIGMTSFQLAKGVGIPLVDMMPGVVANKGWKFKGWNPELDPKERWYRFERDTVITATYESDNGGGAGYDPSEEAPKHLVVEVLRIVEAQAPLKALLKRPHQVRRGLDLLEVQGIAAQAHHARLEPLRDGEAEPVRTECDLALDRQGQDAVQGLEVRKVLPQKVQEGGAHDDLRRGGDDLRRAHQIGRAHV